MQDEKPKKSARRVPWILGSILFLLLLSLLLLQSSNLWQTLSVDSANDTLLLYALSSLNFIAFIIFGFIFLRSIVKLVRERRTFQLGSKIKTRLLIYFFTVSLLPIVAMAGFSYLFMNRALDRWFTQIPENVVRAPIRLEEQAIADQQARLGDTVHMLAKSLDGRPVSERELQQIVQAGNLLRIQIFGRDGRILIESERSMEQRQKLELERQLRPTSGDLTGDLAASDGSGSASADALFQDGRRLVIVTDVHSVGNVGELVNSTLGEFDLLKKQQVGVRQIGLLTLGMLTFLLIFASSWVAFYVARGLTQPIQALAFGADEIAKGNLGYRIDVLAEDELALLVDAFNQMSLRLEENAAELGERQRYIETVIETLPNGVISFDLNQTLSTINRAALNILKLEDADLTGVRLETLVQEENRAVLSRLLSRAKRVGHASEQTVLKRENVSGSPEVAADLAVALTAAALPDGKGVVLVIEDLSELIAAQRASAWQEVARRMAHEIKNPLTPIQLSAERIAKKCLETPVVAATAAGIHTSISPEQSRKIVKEGTDTILREVQSLKSMVDEFSRFARLPNAKLETGSVNEIVAQAVAMYDDRFADVNVVVQLAPVLPGVMIDAEQFKRVCVNLIENSTEAFDEHQIEKTITITTRHDVARDLIVIELSDNGRGIEPSDIQKLFQPYFSTKGRGTGLGLAIVSRIVAEHKGKIKVAANKPRGAKFIIELPVSSNII
ncbi:MAG: ATP-binding protein [Acidobacteriota bacterium]